MTRNPEMVVISDIHLGTYGCKAKELMKYLQVIKPKVLNLNGDIIDGWQFSKRYFPQAHFEVINEIFHKVAKGTLAHGLYGKLHISMARQQNYLGFWPS